jgi:S-adenosylmethionine:tRNA ribosyltransferase-isomerase
MLLDRENRRISHHRFFELPDLLRPDELVVLNDARVVPARIRLPDRNAELLLLEQLGPCAWRAMVRPGKWFSVGRKFVVGEALLEVSAVTEQGERVLKSDRPLDLHRLGEMPLPPYLKRKAEEIDSERYQTVYARAPGAVAAPTAGLHFTPEILERVPHVFVTLDVGPGTFQPVKAERIGEHHMHWESFRLGESAAEKIRQAGRVLAVGTTTVRVLETLAAAGSVQAGSGRTNMFIYPPYTFRRVDSLLTNFHLPRSTLLMLVAAFAGRELVLEAYRQAVAANYRFYSYGDCMLIR